MKKYLPAVFFPLIIIIVSCSSGDTQVPVDTSGITIAEPLLNCDSAVLADYNTGTILFEKNSDLLIPPASMTKLVVNYIVFKEIEKGTVTLDDLVPVDRESDFRNQPPRSSLMFIEEGQTVTLRECLIGLAIPSGNDAAVAVAKYISGDVDTFIKRMNFEMKNLGLEKTVFTDTSGYSEHNLTTASEFLKVIPCKQCGKDLDLFPGSIADFHSLASFSYPVKANYFENGKSVYGTIVQYNHNELVGRVEGVDGLKTGYIDESGFNVSLTAERDGMRLVSVIMGSRADTPKEARKRGGFDAAVLLSYGFNRFKTVEINPEMDEKRIRVWNSREKYADLEFPESVKVTVPAEELGSLTYRFELNEPLTAPVERGDYAGRLNIYSSAEVIKSYPVIIADNIGKGNLFNMMIDEGAVFFKYGIFVKN